ncbi:MAG: hypothetical protein ABIG11_01765 [bacterium]
MEKTGKKELLSATATTPAYQGNKRRLSSLFSLYPVTRFPRTASLILTFCASFFILILRPGVSFAIDSRAGTSGATFLKLGAGSPRAQALGRAYVALAEGPDAMVWNPAGIASSQLKEVQFSYLNWLQGYSGQYLGYVHPVGQTVLGVNIASFGMDGFEVRDEQGFLLQNEIVRVQDGFASLNAARSFFLERFLVGANIKGISENNDGTKHTAVVFDAGALLKIGRRLSLGWAVQNMGGNTDDVARIHRFGAAVKAFPFLTLSVENEAACDNRSRIGIGAEIILPEQLLQMGKVSFRAGYFSSDSYGQSDDGMLKRLNLDRSSGFSIGFGLYTAEIFGYGLGLDYAMVPYGALGKSSQVSLRFQF